MADDDQDRGPKPDPWDEIVADGLGDFGDDMLTFEETAGEAVTPVDPPPPGDEAESDPDVAAAAAEAVRGDAEETDIEDWLSGDDVEAGAGSPVLSVFSPEETAGGLSGVAIGTGTSGIAEDVEPGPVLEDEVGGVTFAATSAAGDSAVDDWAGIEPVPGADAAAGAGAEEMFEVTTAAAAAGSAAVALAGPQARKPAVKSRGIGRLLGIVLGGVLAIPVALSILLFGLGQDPLGLAALVPSSLLPAKLRPPNPPAAVVVAVAPAEPAAVDEVPPPAEPALPEPTETVADEAANSAAEPEPSVAAVVVDEAAGIETAPEPEVPADPAAVVDVAVVDPQPVPEPVPMPEPGPPLPEPPLDAVAVAAPALDALVAEPSPAPAPPPEPLDMAALDAAVAEAKELGEALGAVDDRENRAYTLLRTRWYRSLARVAEELVALDHAAAAAGRPLDASPENVALLHGTIGGREALTAELAALAPDWLAYAKRGSDGVVLPVTFESARRVGPYWAARATLTGAAGRPRTVTLISRTEPTAVSGERLVVTGVALDDAVVWAADVRAAAAAGDAAPGF